ncbi:MAG: aminoacyl-tRNA hydrolase [Spirochaetales bacterium]|nr:aminoacyl-tRNA hydrolase [Leptospiraceae bacterium]MCP5483730.1 aminoacyl-tRNA hydrolase [Spirochaetales bacterium]MCP5484785.1 aminoacyl-tRNA hydrolase [Spirochaetales bacterium]
MQTLLIVGLGNPGARYVRTRHNAGFMVLEQLARKSGIDSARTRWQARVAEHEVEPGRVRVVYLTPQTFMNLSGDSVKPAMREYRVAVDHMLVVHDEIELPFSEMRFKLGGGHKGHNGLRDIIDKIGSREFHRLRFGVGRPDHDDVAGHLLSPFRPEEESALPGLVEQAADMAARWTTERVEQLSGQPGKPA